MLVGLPPIQVPFDSDEFEHYRVHDEIQFTLFDNKLQLWTETNLIILCSNTAQKHMGNMLKYVYR